MAKHHIIGLLWSVLLIVVPALMVASGMYPTLMTGVLIGATVRFGTDIGITAMASGSGNSFDQFTGSQLPLVAILMIVQFGTLLGSLGYFIITGSVLALGIVAAIIASYVFAIVMQGMAGVETQAASPPEQTDDESEWRFDEDDV